MKAIESQESIFRELQLLHKAREDLPSVFIVPERLRGTLERAEYFSKYSFRPGDHFNAAEIFARVDFPLHGFLYHSRIHVSFQNVEQIHLRILGNALPYYDGPSLKDYRGLFALSDLRLGRAIGLGCFERVFQTDNPYFNMGYSRVNAIKGSRLRLDDIEWYSKPSMAKSLSYYIRPEQESR